MALSKISGNQISNTTEAIITTLSFLNTDSVFTLPTGTQAQRPGSAALGSIRFNLTTDGVEVYKQDDGTGSNGWAPAAGGGPSLGEESVIRTNSNVIAENITIGPTANNDVKYTNGMSAGPITINSGYTVTIENGASWSVR